MSTCHLHLEDINIHQLSIQNKRPRYTDMDIFTNWYFPLKHTFPKKDTQFGAKCLSSHGIVIKSSRFEIKNLLMCFKNVRVHVEKPDWTISQRLIII